METNKEEATRAKEIAEKKFHDKDVMGAKSFALKAQKLFPGLDGLSQLLTTLDVYIAAERKINGEVDWYGVLGVDPSADDDDVRKQYRKLALTLHPDKNKSVGAEGAFKMVSEAWSLLCDKTKRVSYDLKRRPRGIYHKVSTANPPASGRNGFHHYANNGNASVSSQNSTAPHHYPGPPPPPPQRKDTFWTACARCRMQYEYLRCYLDQTLLCPNCKQPFLAREMPAPNTNLPPWSSSMHKQNTNHSRAGGNFAAPGSWSQLAPGSTNATMEDAVKGKTHAFKRALTSEDRGEKARKRRHVYEPKVVNGVEKGCRVIPEIVRQGFSSGGMSDSMRELLQVELRQMLMDKARTVISKKLAEHRTRHVMQKSVDKEFRGKEKERTKSSVNRFSKVPAVNDLAKTVANGVNFDRNKHGTLDSDVVCEDKGEQNMSAPVKSVVGSGPKSPESKLTSMNVPDPDFHDFDSDRTEASFSDNQVWAAYDDDDGMPRYYAMVRRVISNSPFKIEISWLNSRSNAEFARINWVGSGFYKTSGEFRTGRLQTNTSINSFSHRVHWTKGTRGMICIYPKKGDIWAVYSNWSPDWNEHTPDDVIHKYDMVEVLEDYSEEKGATIVPLIKVVGFKTVFHRHLDPEHIRIIPKEEMFRFSHQVPSYVLTGQESPSAPRGCRELDPAATPLELLNVITETQDQVSEVGTKKANKST